VENTLNFVKAGPMIYVNFIVIVIIIAETKIGSILNHLSGLHNKIQFTMEK